MAEYVTTPIYYVNASPHLGHAYTTIAGDVITRWHRQRGRDAFFLTGTDEHGTKIADAAAEAGVDVREFVDANAQRFRELLPLLDAEADFFIRTTDAPHERFVQEVLARLHEQGDIYKDTYSGLYCTGCERYYAEDELLEGNVCPDHRRPAQHMEEENWFFRLSAYQDRLLEHYDANPGFVRPRSRFNEARSFIERGLDDISISRSSISWGVPVPWDEEQVFYVWIDALFNYASALTYAREGEGEDLTGRYWPPTVQLLANDILKFHGTIWPALLMAAGMDLPEQLFVHGYLLQGGHKMSKSVGEVFDPFPVLEAHGADPVRFYVLREVQFGQDGSVSQEGFEARYDGELANDLGNLVSRSTAMLDKYLGGGAGGDPAVVPAVPDDSPLRAAALEALEAHAGQMDELQLTAALETCWTLVRALNRHVEERAPWKLAKDEDQGELLATTLGELAEGLLAVAWMLTPVMPSTAASIRACFGVDGPATEEHRWGAAAGNPVSRPEPLFPRLERVG